MGVDLDDHELYLTQCVSRVLDVTHSPHDDNSAPSMYDVTLSFSDGRRGALEITRVANGSFGLANVAASTTLPLPGDSDWLLFCPPGSSPKDLRTFRTHVPSLVQTCDAAGVDSPERLPDVDLFQLPPDSALAWYLVHRPNIMLWRVGPRRADNAQLNLAPPPYGGRIDHTLLGLDTWVASQLQEPWYVENREKLVASGLTDLHLAVSLHDGAVPGDLLMSFMRRDGEPYASVSELDLAPLTGLWLFVPYAPEFARWQPGSWTLYPR